MADNKILILTTPLPCLSDATHQSHITAKSLPIHKTKIPKYLLKETNKPFRPYFCISLLLHVYQPFIFPIKL